jgi:hypothetical protein
MAWLKSAVMTLLGLYWDVGYTEVDYIQEGETNIWVEEGEI